MAYSQQEFVQRIKQQYPQYQGLDDAELFNRVISKYPQYQKMILTDADSGAMNFVQGVAKSAGQSVLGLGTLGRKIQGGISRAGNAVLGKYNPFKMGEQGVFDAGSEENLRAQELVKADTKGEKFGKFVGDVAQFAVPGSYAAKSTTGANLATRAAAQAGTSALVTTAQEGEINKKVAINAALSAGMVGAGDLIKYGADKLSNKFPEWLVKPLLKQSPTAKMEGKDITPFLAKSGRVGSVDKLLQMSDEQMSSWNAQIDDVLSKSNKTVNLWSIADDVADDINRQGGMTTAEEVLDIIQKQAYQGRGTLLKAGSSQADDISIKVANSLRSQLDDTLYAGKDYLRQTPTENKAILEMFTNSLRRSVQSTEPATKEMFKQYSKEITLKKALEKALASGGGKNSIGLLDLVIGGGAWSASGNPLVGVAAAGGRKAFETPQVKTALAATFRNSDKAVATLARLSPEIQGAVLAFLSSLEEDETGTQSMQTR